MKEKTKIVTLDDVRYQVSRFRPDVGTFILMRLMGAVVKAGAENASNAPTSAEGAEPPSPQDVARMVCGAALMGNVDQEFHQYVQRQALVLCSRLEQHEGTETPIPISTATELLPDIADDFGLVMRLTMECLVFNFSDFFAQGGMRALGAA